MFGAGADVVGTAKASAESLESLLGLAPSFIRGHSESFRLTQFIVEIERTQVGQDTYSQ